MKKKSKKVGKKNKVNKKSLFIFIIVLIVFIVLFVFINYSKIHFNKNTLSFDNYSNIDEIHFTQMPITYSLYVNSYDGYSRGNDYYEIERIETALDIIERSPDYLVTFKEVGFNECPLLDS